MAASNAVMTVLFAVMASVQYNDPDPVLWTTAYGLSAVCCALFVAGYRPVLLSGIVALACGVGAAYLLFRALGPVGVIDQTGEEMMGLTEVFRETLGLLISAFWTGFLSWWGYRHRETDSVVG